MYGMWKLKEVPSDVCC